MSKIFFCIFQQSMGSYYFLPSFQSPIHFLPSSFILQHEMCRNNKNGWNDKCSSCVCVYTFTWWLNYWRQIPNLQALVPFSELLSSIFISLEYHLQEVWLQSSTGQKPVWSVTIFAGKKVLALNLQRMSLLRVRYKHLGICVLRLAFCVLPMKHSFTFKLTKTQNELLDICVKKSKTTKFIIWQICVCVCCGICNFVCGAVCVSGSICVYEYLMSACS